MSRALKTVTVTWSWAGDPFALRGFNVAVTPTGAGVHPDTHAVARGFAGPTATSYEFDNVALEVGVDYAAWVQAVYEGADSDWVTQGTVTAADDGTATIPPAYSATTGARWELEPGQYSRIYDDAGAIVFEAVLSGPNVGDIYVGDVAGGKGMSWDKATQTLTIGGSAVIGGNTASALETTTGAQAKADAAETNAKGYADTQVATRERKITKASTAPSSPAADDLWIDTSTTPNVVKRWTGTAWVKATPTDTAELSDGAGLGTTAVWSNVTGAGKPADNADRTADTMNAGVTITLANGGIRAGKSGYPDTTAGWFLGRDSDGVPKFRVGGTTHEMAWDGTNLTIRGSLTVEPGSTGYQNLADKPPLAQSLWVPPDGELFEFRDHFSGSKGTLPL